jgi:hypothetical protein
LLCSLPRGLLHVLAAAWVAMLAAAWIAVLAAAWVAVRSQEVLKPLPPSGQLLNQHFVRPSLKTISLSRYSFEGTLQAIYGFDRDPLHCDDEYCHFNDGKDVLKELDVDSALFWLDFVVLCVFFILLRGGCYIVLRWRVKSQR